MNRVRITAGPAVPSLQSVAARFVPEASRSLFWGCLTASLSCGTLLAYTFSPPLIEDYGWPFAFELFGGAGFVIALLWAVFGADAPKIPLIETAPPAAKLQSEAPSSQQEAPCGSGWRT